ncbi:MAG: hypothetical protein IJI20_04105 [Firmicutes bacterium]|nr:hypothetical protein [Bacillota bacterium]
MSKRKRTFLLAFALALMVAVAAAQVPATLAYFTDVDRAEMNGVVDLAWKTEIHEKVVDNNKHVTIENTGDTDVVVRVAVYAGTNVSVSGEDWTSKDGWWYYGKILAPGETTSELLAEVIAADMPQTDFNIVVVHESSRVVYENNTTLKKPAGWALVPEVK